MNGGGFSKQPPQQDGVSTSSSGGFFSSIRNFFSRNSGDKQKKSEGFRAESVQGNIATGSLQSDAKQRNSVNTVFQVDHMENSTGIGHLRVEKDLVFTGNPTIVIGNGSDFGKVFNEMQNFKNLKSKPTPPPEEKKSAAIDEESADEDEDKAYILQPIIIGSSITRQNLMTELDTKLSDSKLTEKVVNISGIVAIGKRFFLHSYCKTTKKYQYIIWFDEAYNSAKSEKKLNDLKTYFSLPEKVEQRNILPEIIKKVSRNKKLLLVLNCSFYDYTEIEMKNIFDQVIAHTKVVVILISRIQQILYNKQHQSLKISQMDEDSAMQLVTTFSQEKELKWDESFCKSVIRACLYYPALIVQYCTYLEGNLECKAHETTDNFPFPFLVDKHQPTHSTLSPHFPSYDLNFSISLLARYSRPNLLAKMSYAYCVKYAIDLVNNTIKKNLSDEKEKNCIFNLLVSHSLFTTKKSLTKEDISLMCSGFCKKKDGEKVAGSFINTAGRFLLIRSSTEKNQLVLEDIVLKTSQYFRTLSAS